MCRARSTDHADPTGLSWRSYLPERKPHRLRPPDTNSPNQDTHMGMAVAPTWTGNPSANLATWASATKPKIAAATLQNAWLGISVLRFRRDRLFATRTGIKPNDEVA